VSFSVLGVTPGASVDVEITFHGGPALTRYFKLHDGAWEDFTANATVAGDVVTLALTDGGAGDDDDAPNGVIVDPGGPAAVTAGGAPPGDTGTGGPTAVLAQPRLTG
jgi:hypothetical protein